MTNPETSSDLVKLYRFRPIGAPDWSEWRIGYANLTPASGCEWEEVDFIPSTTIERLAAERDEARQIVRDTHWMAVRYADGRKSYAPGMCNDALRKAYDAGWLVYSEFRQHDLDPQYAREGDKPEWQSIEARALAAESLNARQGEVLKWHSVVDEPVAISVLARFFDREVGEWVYTVFDPGPVKLSMAGPYSEWLPLDTFNHSIYRAALATENSNAGR